MTHYFQPGSCTYGDGCRFAHPSAKEVERMRSQTPGPGKGSGYESAGRGGGGKAGGGKGAGGQGAGRGARGRSQSRGRKGANATPGEQADDGTTIDAEALIAENAKLKRKVTQLGNVVCAAYAKGTCKNGDNCSMGAHISGPEYDKVRAHRAAAAKEAKEKEKARAVEGAPAPKGKAKAKAKAKA